MSPRALPAIPGVGDLVGVGVRGELRRAGGAAGVERARRGPGRGRLRTDEGGRLAARRPGRPGTPVTAGTSGDRLGSGRCWRGCRRRAAATRTALHARPGGRARGRCCHSCRSSSGPAATSTRAPERRSSSAMCSAASALLIGAAMPASCAARVAVISSCAVRGQQGDRVGAAHAQACSRFA